MDIQQLYQDYSIDYKTEGHKHCRPGWVNTECPWCVGNAGYHLGYNLQSDIYVCWRCGFHPIAPTVSKLLRISDAEAYSIVKKYGIPIPRRAKEAEVKIRAKAHRFPSGTSPLEDNHKRYLLKRGFDPEYLEKEWRLLGTGPISYLDQGDFQIDYKFRILIPFFWDGIQVSFDSRDITGKHISKYIACPGDRELIPHKSILYGKQESWNPDIGICLEGPTDVWRFGPLSFATSGIKYTPAQVRLIAKIFKRVAVCFDGGESQALLQANLLIGELRFRGVDAFRVDIKEDPGAMSQKEANYLVKQLIK